MSKHAPHGPLAWLPAPLAQLHVDELAIEAQREQLRDQRARRWRRSLVTVVACVAVLTGAAPLQRPVDAVLSAIGVTASAPADDIAPARRRSDH